MKIGSVLIPLASQLGIMIRNEYRYALLTQCFSQLRQMLLLHHAEAVRVISGKVSGSGKRRIRRIAINYRTRCHVDHADVV